MRIFFCAGDFDFEKKNLAGSKKVAENCRLVLNAEHGSGFVAPLGQLVEEHQLLDVAVGADPAGQVCLESNP